MGLGVELFLEKLVRNSKTNNDKEEHIAEKIFTIIKCHLRNIVQHGEDALEGDITLFRDSIMPTLRYRYPLMYRRVEELWRERIIEV